MPRCISSWTSFLDRFLVDFCSQLRPPDLDFSSPRCRESKNLLKIVLRSYHRFLIPFWCQLGFVLARNSTKIHPKIDSKRHQKNYRFLDRFFKHLGSILETKLGPKSRSKRSQNAPKTPPRRHQDRPRATRAHKIEIWTIFGPPSLDFRGLWAHFGTILVPILVPSLRSGTLKNISSKLKDQKVNSQARWRVRSSAAHWI